MTHIVTLVASAVPVTAAHVAALGLPADALHWQAPGKALDVMVADKPAHTRILEWRMALAADRIDVFVTAAAGRVKKLMLSDMDSTVIPEETLDEVAAHAGMGPVIADITARAMRGELDFEQALRARVEMMRGIPAATLAAVRDAIVPNPGARELVTGMRAAGAPAVLVSGGFTWFTEHVAELCGFDFHHANILGIKDGALTGTVADPVLDKTAKRNILIEYCARLDLELDNAFAIGDGSNDLPMLQAAGLGIGFRPKPVLLDALDNCIIHGDLTAALYAQGLPVPIME